MTRSREYRPRITAASVRRREQAEAAAEAERQHEENFWKAYDEVSRISKIRSRKKAD